MREGFPDSHMFYNGRIHTGYREITCFYLQVHKTNVHALVEAEPSPYADSPLHTHTFTNIFNQFNMSSIHYFFYSDTHCIFIHLSSSVMLHITSKILSAYQLH